MSVSQIYTRRFRRAPWTVEVTLRPTVGRLPASAQDLATVIASTLTAAGAPSPASIALFLADDRELATLNETHMGKTGPTDVLSFPLLPPGSFPPHERGADDAAAQAAGAPDDALAGAADDAAEDLPAFVLPPGEEPHLGDIVVSVERAIEQADSGRGGWDGDRAWSPAEELRLLVTHGALHVCGWDHAEPVEEAAMRALERRLLETE